MAKDKKKDKQLETTNEWSQYQEGIKYKQSIGLFDTVKYNYLFYIGDHWNGVDAKDLPKPVFNFIKQAIRYKVATVMANDTKIVYFPIYTGNDKYDATCTKICNAMTLYADMLREGLKLDYHNEMLVTDAAVAGSAYTYWRFNKKKGEVEFDVVDVTNIFPGDVNTTDLQRQPYIIISFRRNVEQLKQEALALMKEKANALTEEDIENLAGDNDNRNESGEFGSKEMTDEGKPSKIACLVKMWRDPETDTIHIKKSVKNYVIMDDYDTELEYYPVAGMVWEPNKNSFYGVSDITSIIPNQKYVNKMAAMIMQSTVMSAIPKAVYDSDLIENWNNQIGTAIAVSGNNGQAVGNLATYITPPQISPDAKYMFTTGVSLSKELMSASDAALGTANTTSASGKAILLQMEASATPLETNRRRFYSYMEDVARIWLDMWRVYQGASGKKFTITDELGQATMYKLSPKDVTTVKANVRVDVGPCSRYSEAVVIETLDNMLLAGLIPFEWYVDWIPDSTGLPKQDMKMKLQAAKQAQPNAPQGQGGNVSGANQQGAKQGGAGQQQNPAEQDVSDAEAAQLAQSISSMEAGQARSAIEQLGAKSPKVAARVLQALPREKLDELGVA